jgi:hypothetical protein
MLVVRGNCFATARRLQQLPCHLQLAYYHIDFADEMEADLQSLKQPLVA